MATQTVDPREMLLASIRVQTAYDRKVLALLRQATRDVNRQLAGILGTNVGDAIRRDQLRASRAALLERAAALNAAIGNVVADGKIAAAIEADRAMLAYDAVLMESQAGDAKIAAYLKSSGVQTSKTAVENAERRLLGRSYVPLAQQVYRTGVVASGLIDSAINSALARNLSAREFAKEVSGLINPSTPGGVSYASMRLARTELNNAFHAAAVDNARDKPWVQAMKWNLSSSHPKPDECDAAASDQHFKGGGPGEYRIDDVPSKFHPHDLCFVTPVEDDEDAFLDNLLGGEYDDYIDQQIAERRVPAGTSKSTAKASPTTLTTPPRPSGKRVN